MRFLYSVINFLILLGLILLIGGKKIFSIFRERYERINRELDEAEKPFVPEAPARTDFVCPDADELVSSEKEQAEKKVERIRTYTSLECDELTLSKVTKERRALVEFFAEAVAERYRESFELEKEQEHCGAVLREILPMLTITPGDRSYLHQYGVLYVTLSSAFPLPDGLREQTEKAVLSLLGEGEKISFRVDEKPELIGGLTLRIGDTVYDGSLSEQIYRFKNNIEKIQLTGNDSVRTVLDSFKNQTDVMERKISVYQLGRVISVSDGICFMDGLADIMYGEVVEFECGERGMVLDIQRNRIGCVIFGQYEHIETYTKVRRVGRIASVPAGESLLGRVVNSVGSPIDAKGPLLGTEKRPIEFPAPGILDRSPVNRPLQTGIKIIDALIPIGRGQRELIVGDRQTGKTAIVIDTICNQKDKNVICIYVGIGQKETTVSDIREKLEAAGALKYTVIVSATASESAAMQYTAPFAATAIGEYFMYSGRDVLIIYDDLSKHAVAYRELSLLLQRPSGREAYPGDIFYLHSRLLERSAQLSEELGGGSMTALPLIETQAGDISSYIPTNVISITDGQIFLETELFNEGQRPAVNVGLSVSRVGGAAQTKLMKQVSASLRTKLAQYRELAEFTQFGADMDSETRRTLNSGEHLTEALKQNRFSPLADYEQALLLFTVSEGYADEIDVHRMQDFERYLLTGFASDYPELLALLKTGNKLGGAELMKLHAAVKETSARF